MGKPDRLRKGRQESEMNVSAGTRVLSVVRGFAADNDQAQFDRIIHERIRLAIISALAVNELLSFTELKQVLGATDGNLSVHARKLEDAGYITSSKYFEGRVPRTEYRITNKGRQALDHYLSHMEALIRAMRDQ